MTRPDRVSGTSIVPSLRYRNVSVAINWLCAAFGFERHSVVKGDDGTIVYAGLEHGNALILVGPVRDSEFDRLLKQPDEIGGAETQSCYIVVKNADVHHARAKAAGAEILIDIREDEHGGRSYSCRDLEGHIWNFGTYDPAPAEGPVAHGLASPPHAHAESTLQRPWSRGLVAAGLVALGLMTLALSNTLREDASADVGETVAQERAARLAAEHAARDAGKSLARERTAREEAEKTAAGFAKQLESERREKAALAVAGREKETAARASAEEALKLSEEKWLAERLARESAEKAARESRDLLDREREARERAEQLAREAADALERERAARESAERLAQQMEESADRPPAGARAARPARPPSGAAAFDAPMPPFVRRP